MLTPLVKKYSTIHISGREYRGRYSLNALLYLEMAYKPIDEILSCSAIDWTIEDVFHLTKAALVDLPENRKSTINRDWDKIKPDIFIEDVQARDLMLLKSELLDAISDSLPEPVIGQKSNEKCDIDGLKLRSVYVDILHRPEKEFYTATLKEISERTEAYFSAKGFDNGVIKAEEFDDEGM